MGARVHRAHRTTREGAEQTSRVVCARTGIYTNAPPRTIVQIPTSRLAVTPDGVTSALERCRYNGTALLLP